MSAQLFRRKQQTCTCPHGVRSLGRLDGVSMGRGMVRLSTTKGCSEHDTCHHWTAENRAKYAIGRPWSVGPYCPLHTSRNCPS